MFKKKIYKILVPIIIFLYLLLCIPGPEHEKLIITQRRVPQLGLNFLLEYNVTGGYRRRYSTVQYNTVQYIALQYSTVQ